MRRTARVRAVLPRWRTHGGPLHRGTSSDVQRVPTCIAAAAASKRRAAGLLGGQAVYLYSQFWLAQWASASPEEQQRAYWIWGYALMAVGILAVSLARSFLWFGISVRAATRIHDAMIERVRWPAGPARLGAPQPMQDAVV